MWPFSAGSTHLEKRRPMIDQPVSRRRFLKILGTACALCGSGTVLADFLAGCARDQVASNTTATIVHGETTSTTEPSTTTMVTTTVERGRPLRIGVLTAKTGRLALFSKADDWWMRFALKAMPDGILCGDRKLRKIDFITEDNGSAGDSAAKAANRLIREARVDILLCSGAPNVVNGAAAQAEALECPFISDFVPWRSFIFDRGGSIDRPFKWTYAHAIGVEDVAASFLQMWNQLATNKKVGALFPDDSQGPYWADPGDGLPGPAEKAGYEFTFPGLYPALTRDFTAVIEEFKTNGCEICCGYMSSADLLAFWDQAVALEFRPKVASIAGGLIFPQAMQALPSSAANMTAECLWQPNWPYSDSITGKTAQELADDYMDETGEQWTVGIGQYAKFEWLVDVFRRVDDILDKRDTIARVRTTRLETCLGLIDFTAPVTLGDPSKSRRPAENIYKAPVAGCQWVKSAPYPYEPRTIAIGANRDLPLEGTMQQMTYSTGA
jgi:branched-chain amino acid transport system substrate-binding protein